MSENDPNILVNPNVLGADYHNAVVERIHKILATTAGIKEASPSYVGASAEVETPEAVVAPITIYLHGLHPQRYPYPWAYVDFKSDSVIRKSPFNYLHRSKYVIMFHDKKPDPKEANANVTAYCRIADVALRANDRLNDPSGNSSGNPSSALVKQITSSNLQKFPVGFQVDDGLVVACSLVIETLWFE